MTAATLSEVAYRSIRAMVLGGTVPPGKKLTLETLAAAVGMGTTPLREALSRLASEGLVVGQGQRGYWAAPVSKQEIEQITELRLALELKGLSGSIQRGDLAWETRVVAAFHRLSRATQMLSRGETITPTEWEQHNRDFHTSLIDACGNDWLLRFMRTLYDHSERYRCLSVGRRAVPLGANLAEHEALMNASLARQEEKAVELLRSHIEGAARAAISTLFPESGTAGGRSMAGRRAPSRGSGKAGQK